jgi:hypothetical protein
MLQILAETGATYPETVVGACVLLVLGWLSKSGYSIILTKRKSGKREGDETVAAERAGCPLHGPLVKLLDERNTVIREELKEIKVTFAAGQKIISDSLGVIHRRIDEALKKK